MSSHNVLTSDMTTPTASQGASTQASDAKFPIIGIYGVSGCRKTNLRKELEERLGHGRFHYLDGSDAIAKYTEALGEGRPGGLLAFKKGPDSQQKKIREGTIRGIQADCQNMGRIGIVTGHVYLCEDGSKKPEDIWTESDAGTYTHIFLLAANPDMIKGWRDSDSEKGRSTLTSAKLREWQDDDKSALETRCEASGLFSRSCRQRTHWTRFQNVSYNKQSNWTWQKRRKCWMKLLHIDQAPRRRW
jgi:hypothetical protein